MNTHGNENKTSQKKRHEKNVVVTKAHGVRMKGITIKGKADGKSWGISSLVKLKDVQGKISKTFILYDIIVTIDKNQVVIDTISAFDDCDNSPIKNMIDVIWNVEVLTTEIGPDNSMLNATTHFEPKEVDNNINVCKVLCFCWCMILFWCAYNVRMHCQI